MDNNISDDRSGETPSNNKDDANEAPEHSSTAQEDHQRRRPTDKTQNGDGDTLTLQSDNDTTTTNNNINIKERIIQTKRVSYADSVDTEVDGTTTTTRSSKASRRSSTQSQFNLWFWLLTHWKHL